jgi:catechol 2,3-dioxygenase-like lactoylglutathione lyase family enzyme
MEPRLSFVTLGVTDLERSRRFYRDLFGIEPRPTPPEVAFFELGKTWLSLYSRESLAADAGVSPEGSGFTGITLSHNVRSQEEVDEVLREAEAAGATLLRPGHRAYWGGYIGYFSDPDGYVWEIAWNPSFPHV